MTTIYGFCTLSLHHIHHQHRDHLINLIPSSFASSCSNLWGFRPYPFFSSYTSHHHLLYLFTHHHWHHYDCGYRCVFPRRTHLVSCHSNPEDPPHRGILPPSSDDGDGDTNPGIDMSLNLNLDLDLNQLTMMEEEGVFQVLGAKGTGSNSKADMNVDEKKELGFVANDRMGIQFTCCRCETRVRKTFWRQSYENGVVVIRCPGCSNHHLIADHKNYFSHLTSLYGTDIEQIAQKSGQEFSRVSEDVFNLEWMLHQESVDSSGRKKSE